MKKFNYRSLIIPLCIILMAFTLSSCKKTNIEQTQDSVTDPSLIGFKAKKPISDNLLSSGIVTSIIKAIRKNKGKLLYLKYY